MEKWQKLCLISELSIQKTLDCGQCFRWEETDGVWRGAAFGRTLRLAERGDTVETDAPEADLPLWREYFDLGTGYAEIAKRVASGEFMTAAAEFSAGLRILRQEPWEALCSFIVSQCNNIPRIKKIIAELCRLFGDPLGGGMYAFPAARTLAGLSEADLAPLRSGYRAKYIIEAAKAAADGGLDLDALREADCGDALRELMRLPGVGLKVASCAALFGLRQYDAFPVDTWVKKALREYFPPDFDHRVFSPWAGVAQQYMFYYIRHLQSKN
ncbi:MAG: DNA-3-methyladenine glycosylase 2 family protein [Oscillospiraceae bacterium]|jgi:N-glycosylase/DNA lyase|nr:DNA-3-methyladenine glycosylase 2 family protein [Oscillospiraceae bacterium]